MSTEPGVGGSEQLDNGNVTILSECGTHEYVLQGRVLEGGSDNGNVTTLLILTECGLRKRAEYVV